MTGLLRPAALPLLLMSAAAFASPTTETDEHRHLDREHSFTVARPPTEAFVLFEPVGEKC